MHYKILKLILIIIGITSFIILATIPFAYEGNSITLDVAFKTLGKTGITLLASQALYKLVNKMEGEEE